MPWIGPNGQPAAPDIQSQLNQQWQTQHQGINPLQAQYNQPGATLQDTQQNVIGKGISNVTEQATQQPTIQSAQAGAQTAQADAALKQKQVQQQNIVTKAQQVFEKELQKSRTGWVSPATYNAYQAQYVGAGGDAQAFANNLGPNYVDPNDIHYDIPGAKEARGTLPTLKNVIHSYASLDKAGPDWARITDIPLVGQQLKAHLLHSEIAHDSFIRSVAGNLKSLGGAGQGSGFRFNIGEINNLIGSLPTSVDTGQTFNDKISRLDQYLHDNWSVNYDKEVMGQ